MPPLIEFRSVTKSFARHTGRLLLRDRLTHWLKGAHRDRFVALKNISLTIPAGQRIALVGPSGTGKSTLLNLIPRFYDITSGSIIIDNFDINK